MKLEKFILIGHSLGAFFSTSYALKYPQNVHALILEEACKVFFLIILW
jgi:pimeloyl-ACP methyl ester carboxylesterase